MNTAVLKKSIFSLLSTDQVIIPVFRIILVLIEKTPKLTITTIKVTFRKWTLKILRLFENETQTFEIWKHLTKMKLCPVQKGLWVAYSCKTY